MILDRVNNIRKYLINDVRMMNMIDDSSMMLLVLIFTIVEKLKL